MAQGFGHNAHLAWGEESTYGTAVTRTKFLEVEKLSPSIAQSVIAKPSLRSPSSKRGVNSKNDPSLETSYAFPYEGSEQILKHAMGSVSTANPESGRYVHTFTLASNLPTGLTLEVNPDSANVGNTLRLAGSQVTKLTLKQELENLLMADVSFVCRNPVLTTLTSPSFPTFKQIDWEQFSLTHNGNSYLCENFEVTIENTLATDRFQLGSRLRKGLGRSGFRKVTGKFTVEFDAVVLLTDFINLTGRELVATWMGPALATDNYKLVATFPNVYLTGNVPSIDSPGPIKQEVNFEAFISSADNDEMRIALTNSASSV